MMTQTFEEWSKPTKAIFNGILLYCLAGLLYPFFDFFNSAEQLFDFASALDRGSFDMGVSALDVICWLLLVGIIVGVVLYTKGLGQFAQILDADDAVSVRKVRTAAILLIIAAGVDFIPLLGWVGGILNIIAFILMLIGFSALKKSATFNVIAKSGASLLFVSMILLLIAAALGLIPAIGGVFQMILNPIAFIMMIVGWSRIKNAVTV